MCFTDSVFLVEGILPVSTYILVLEWLNLSPIKTHFAGKSMNRRIA